MRKTVPVMSLRTLMMSLVSVLGVVALLLAVNVLKQSREIYRNAEALAEWNSVTGNCLQAVKVFALERARSDFLLHNPSPADENGRRAIEGIWDGSDSYIGDILANLPEASRTKEDEVRYSWERVKNLRSTLAKNISRGSAERDPAFIRQWRRAANDLVDRLEALAIDVSHVPGSIDSRLDRLSTLRVFALQFRNLAGSESSILASELSAIRVPTHEVIEAVSLLRGRSAQLWLQIEDGAESIDDQELSVALGKVQAGFFGRLRPLQDQMIRAAERGETTTISFRRYMSVSAFALDSTIDLVDIIGRSVGRHTTNRLEQAKRQAFFSMASIVAILIIAGLVAILLIRRITWPLDEIMARISKLLVAYPDASSKGLPMAGGDEFGQVSQALEVLDDAIKARQQSETALNESERISASILACIPQSVIATDINGLITAFSQGAEVMLGYSAAEVIGRQTPLLFLDPKEIQLNAEALSNELGFVVAPDFSGLTARTKASEKLDEREWTYIRKDGVRITVLLAVTSLRDAQGNIDGYLCVATDITERKVFENELLFSANELDKQNNLLTTVLKTIPVGVLMVEAPSGKPLIANDASIHLLGREMPSGVNKDNFTQIFSIGKAPDNRPYPVDELPMVLGMQGLHSHIEDMMIVHPDGSKHTLEVTGSPVRDSKGLVWASVVSLFDITDRSIAKAEMTRMAYYDHLTKLPNRRLFHDRIQMAITQSRRDKARLALLMIDLDKFKPINDNLGHSIGDLLLKAVAKRMQGCLRESDTLSRVGGDEFVVILPNISHEQDAQGVAEKIRLAINAPFDLAGGYKVSIACSIGIAIYPEHGKDEKRLLKNADDAMYVAKELGRNGVQLFSSRISGTATGNESALRDWSIVRLVWHTSYKCGEASIDREHHDLFDRANALIQAYLAREEMPEKFTVALDDLIDCLVEHFANEETILARQHYPDLEDHMLKHQRLVGRALEFRNAAADGELFLGDLVAYLVQEVVIKHMLTEDRKFFPWLKKVLNQEQPDSVVAPNEP